MKYIDLTLGKFLLLLVEGYRTAISPLLPSTCRFYPTCSTYAGNAIRRHGWRRGSLLAVGRVLRCHPLHPGGFDPVPAPPMETKTAGEET